MAQKDLSIAEQLKRAAEALEQIGCAENTAASNGSASRSAPSASSPAPSPASSPAPAGSLSAELIRGDGVLRYGRG